MRNIQIASRTKYLLCPYIRLARLSFLMKLKGVKLMTLLIAEIYLIFQIVENRFLAIWDTFCRSKNRQILGQMG